MSVSDLLFTGSFKGASFLTEGDQTSGGRKNAVHEFVNSDVRNVEDLGLLNRTFTVDALVIGDINQVNYLERRDALLAAIESKGSGELVHPFYGKLNAFALSYTLDQRAMNSGEAKFSIVFKVDSANISPFPTQNSISAIFDSSQQAIFDVVGDLSEVYFVASNIPANYNDALAKIGATEAAFGVATAPFTTNTTTQFYQNLNVFSEEQTQLAVEPEQLASSLQTLFNEANNLTDSSAQAYALNFTFFNFGSTDIPFTILTPAQAQKQDNRDILNSTVNAISLLQAYQQASTLDYETEDDVNNIAQQLETQYQLVRNSQTLSTATQSAIATTRSQMAQFFRQAELAVFKVTTVQTNTMPLTVFMYQYYGNLDQESAISTLNNITNVPFVSGDIKVLTQ